MNKIVEISDLTVAYEKNPPILKDVNLQVFQNDFLGIIGPNGGGKTTLIKTILGLVKPLDGKILFYKNNVLQDNLNIGYLPQINQIDKKFPISVHDVILSGLTTKNNFFFSVSKPEKEKVQNIAEKMGVEDYLKKSVGNLSGGQLQRVLLGRAIVSDPDLLILDEPNSYVDKLFETNFYNILSSLNQTTSIILVSHDIGTIIPLVKNIACVNRGVHYHAGADISTDWLAENYDSCPIEIVAHGKFPHRVLEKHDGCDCCRTEDTNTK
ncbi:MAG: metal ABC transporter ATP-binding protein [Dysgonomonas sp.]